MNTGCKKLASNSSVVSFGRQEQSQNPPLGGGLEKHSRQKKLDCGAVFSVPAFSGKRTKSDFQLKLGRCLVFQFSTFGKFLTLHLYYPRMKLLPPPVPM